MTESLNPMFSRPAAFRWVRRNAWFLGLAAGLALLFLLGWGALGPGRIWAFDRQAHAGGGILLEVDPERFFTRISYRSGMVAILWGILLFVAFLSQWIRDRVLPKVLGMGVLYFAGANLCTQFIKEYLPRLMGVLGFPIHLAEGFPSGHTTMVVSFALTLVMLAPRAWRPWMTAVGGLGAALVGYSLFRAGFHAPIDILAAVLLTFGLALAVMKYLPQAAPEANPGAFQRAPALILGSMGLVWLLSGFMVFLCLDARPPEATVALAAYSAGWRLAAGFVLLAVGFGALRLMGLRAAFPRPLLLLSLLLSLALADAVWQKFQMQFRERSPRLALEDELLRQVWLNRVSQKMSGAGDSMSWMLGGRVPRWGYLAILRSRIQAVDKDLEDFETRPMDGVEREAYLRLIEDWAVFRATLEKTAALVKGAPLEPSIRDKAKKRLEQHQSRMEASLAELMNRVRRRALKPAEPRG